MTIPIIDGAVIQISENYGAQVLASGKLAGIRGQDVYAPSIMRLKQYNIQPEFGLIFGLMKNDGKGNWTAFPDEAKQAVYGSLADILEAIDNQEKMDKEPTPDKIAAGSTFIITKVRGVPVEVSKLYVKTAENSYFNLTDGEVFNINDPAAVKVKTVKIKIL